MTRKVKRKMEWNEDLGSYIVDPWYDVQEYKNCVCGKRDEVVNVDYQHFYCKKCGTRYMSYSRAWAAMQYPDKKIVGMTRNGDKTTIKTDGALHILRCVK